MDCHDLAWMCKANGGDVTETANLVSAIMHKDVQWEIEHREPPPPDSAPHIMHKLWADTAWRRIFRDEQPGWYALLLRKYAVAYYLFRAVVHTADEQTKRILFDAGGLTLVDIMDLEKKRAD